MRRFFLLLPLVALLFAASAFAGDVYVVFWFDTEDFLTPASDDAALRLAKILSEHGVRGTFKLTGEKARMLEKRGRTDVIAALGRHDIGYHTELHSVPPAPAAYLDRLGWDEGVEEFYRREAAGARDVARILKRPLSCYGQPGNSWAPQAYPALLRMGIPVYLDSGRHVGLDHDLFWYGGMLNFFELRGKETRLDLGDNPEGKLAKATADFQAIYDAVRQSERGGVISIVYHPWEFVETKAWDAVNFPHGANPPREKWQAAPLKSREDSERDYANFARYVAYIAARPGAKFATGHDLPALYPDLSKGRSFSRVEVLKIAASAAGDGRAPFSPSNLGSTPADVMERGPGPVGAAEVSYWQSDDRTIALSAAEVFSLLAAATDPAARSFKAESWSGPRHRGRTTRQAPIERWEIRDAAKSALTYARSTGYLPGEVWVGPDSLAPEDFLSVLARALLDPGSAPVAVKSARFLPASQAARDEEKLWSWLIHPLGMRAPNLMDLAALQTWTLKPAFLRGSLPVASEAPAEAFEYDHDAPLNVREVKVERRGEVEIRDISYDSPKGGRVPAYLVAPRGKGSFAAVIWGHWYWSNSAMRDRTQFLDEAVALAGAGVVSLLTDGPVARPGHIDGKDPLRDQIATDRIQQIVDMRRGADLLLARGDVDPRRLAFVGHSYNATTGAFLSGIDRRFKAFALMAGSVSDEVDLRSDEYLRFRQQIGAEKMDAFLAKWGWLDPGNYISQAAPAFVFLQYASQDNFLNPARAKEYAAIVSEPKMLKIYDAPHALNAEARRDRIDFLCRQLALTPLARSVVDSIPDLVQPSEQPR